MSRTSPQRLDARLNADNGEMSPTEAFHPFSVRQTTSLICV